MKTRTLIVGLLVVATAVAATETLTRDNDSPMIRFDRTLVERDRIRHSRNVIEQEYTFHVTSATPVKVVDVETTCCGSGGLWPNIIGRTFEPGTTHTVYLRLRRPSEGGRAVNTATVYTEPASASPIELALIGRFPRRPVINPRPFVVDLASDGNAHGVVSITYRRLPSDAPVGINAENCRWGPFTLVDVQAETHMEEDSDTDLLIDETQLRLECTAQVPLPENRYELQIAYQNGVPSSRLHAVVRRQDAFRMERDYVFCGLLDRGESWRGAILIYEGPRTESGVPRVTVRVDGHPAKTELSECADQRELVIELDAPEQRGRFQSTLTLEADYQDGQQQSATLELSGVVR